MTKSIGAIPNALRSIFSELDRFCDFHIFSDCKPPQRNSIKTIGVLKVYMSLKEITVSRG